jgi:GWxTD domain-containing protein
MSIAFEALGWTLIHSLWQAAVIALVYGLVNVSIAGAQSRVRYGMALVALLAIFVTAAGTLSYEYARCVREHLVMPGGDLSRLLPFPVGGGEMLSKGRHAEGPNLDLWLPWIDGAWMLGVLCLSARTAGGWIWLERLRRNAMLPVPDGMSAVINDLRHRMDIGRRVDLRVSAEVAGTMTMGLFRSVVLVPASALLQLREEEMSALLAHELAHIRRADYVWNLAQTLVETLLFFHPAVWWIGDRMRQEREHCCDEIAVEACGSATVYAQALLSLEEQRVYVSVLAMGADGHQPRRVLLRRIQRVLGEPASAQRSTGSRLIAVAAGCVCVMLFLLPVSRRLGYGGVHAQGQATAGSAYVAGMGKLYRQWVDEDVRWIITSEEMKAFDQLGTDVERDKFIEQFWTRRNPSGAKADAYREEHYRRIAYANVHFKATDEAGWRTDRGRIYIVYGRPDSIDSHPGGGSLKGIEGFAAKDTTPHPFEVWNYKQIDGAGGPASYFFQDSCDCGRFDLGGK